MERPKAKSWVFEKTMNWQTSGKNEEKKGKGLGMKRWRETTNTANITIVRGLLIQMKLKKKILKKI